MKNLIDYIEECGEGCATPGNTLGMGNPMAPGAPGSPGIPGEPGSEPIGAAGPKKEKKNTSKRKKKVNEGILDVEKNEEGMDKLVIIEWLKKVGGEGQLKRDISIDDNLEIDAPRGFFMDLTDGEAIPEFIKFKEIHRLSIECYGDIVIPENFLPKNKEIYSIDIRTYQSEDATVKFEAKTIKATKCNISGDFINVVFPKDFKCGELNMSQCERLMNVENLTSVKIVNFPTAFGANLIRKMLKYKGEIKMNGFGPY